MRISPKGLALVSLAILTVTLVSTVFFVPNASSLALDSDTGEIQHPELVPEPPVLEENHTSTVEISQDASAAPPALSDPSVSSRIVGGGPVAISSVPWQVALIDSSAPNNGDGQFCGGSILSAYWIVTAAHCVHGKSPSQLRVLAGTEMLSTSSLSGISVTAIVKHPQYNSVTFANDIALIQLSTKVGRSDNSVPIAIPDQRPPGGTLATISGWGLTCVVDPDGYIRPEYGCGSEWLPIQLQAASVTINDDDQCSWALGRNYLAPQMLCASSPGYSIDTCFGDSGGPIAFSVEGRAYLAGITSGGIGCAWLSPGLYTNTSNYAEWLRGNAWLAPPPGLPVPSRLAGENRFQTAVRVSQSHFSDRVVDTVVLATGYGFADALSAAPLATKLGAPLLLTQQDVLTAETEQEIRRLAPSRVLIVGGLPAVGTAVEDRLGVLGYHVQRLAGPDRFATSMEIARFGWGAAGASQVFLATGLNFPDALSAGAAAAGHDMPVILVNGGAARLSSAQVDSLRQLGVSQAHIAGSVATVSSGIQGHLAELQIPTSRYGGGNRIETSVLIARRFAKPDVPAYIAQGWNYPDALSGAAIAGAQGSALLLSQKQCLSSGLGTLLQTLKPGQVNLLGGTAALSEWVAQYEAC